MQKSPKNAQTVQNRKNGPKMENKSKSAKKENWPTVTSRDVDWQKIIWQPLKSDENGLKRRNDQKQQKRAFSQIPPNGRILIFGSLSVLTKIYRNAFS